MSMKLILRADVDNLGRLGDIVKVKPGYGRNYLIPQGLAMVATEGNIKAFELERTKLQSKMDAIRAEFRTLADKIKEAEVVIEVRVGEYDKLYGSVTTQHIAQSLEEQGLDVDRRKILLEEPIRALGEYQVMVKLHQDVQEELTVRVTRHGAPMEEVVEEAQEEAADAADESLDEAPETPAAEAVEEEAAEEPEESGEQDS